MMAAKLETILIVDDSSADNYANRRLLTKAAIARDVRDFTSAEAALAYLRSPGRPYINLILVDINMPRMNGFKFADEYEQLYPELKANTRVVMLSASLNPADQQRAENHPAIDGFMQKPIDMAQLQSFLSRLEDQASAR
ncbi:MAG: response regulator [Rhodomicrobium sp.]|jgi:CheY-like chemotaxis protein